MAVSNRSPNVDNYYSGKGIVKWKPAGFSLSTTIGTTTGSADATLASTAGLDDGVTYDISGAGIPADTSFEYVAANGDAIVLSAPATATATAAAATIGEDWRDVGNAPTFEFNPTVTRLDHYSARQGLRFKDRSIVTQRQATVKMIMEEWTAENLLLVLMGIEHAAVAGSPGTPISIDILALSEVQGSLRFIGQNEVGPKMQVDLPNVTLAPGAALSLIHSADEWGPIEVSGEVVGDPTTGIFGTWYWNITEEVNP
jgi:hypothetical protein